ncbi:PROS protein, partial [Rhynochetos jubatus]|nr:PROS protein [Rhynochetos jubatus]
ISNQCSPLPCDEVGYKYCIDGQADYKCICKAGWQGERCEEDRNECEDLNGGCSQRCSNLPGSYRCLCEDGYFMHSNKRDCGGRNSLEKKLLMNLKMLLMERKICLLLTEHNFFSVHACVYVDECAENVCTQLCVNSPGSYRCYCDGKKGFKLSKDMKTCE